MESFDFVRCCLFVSFLKIYVATYLNKEEQNQNYRLGLEKSFSCKQSVLKTSYGVGLVSHPRNSSTSNICKIYQGMINMSNKTGRYI